MTLWFLARGAGLMAFVAATAAVSLGAWAPTQPGERRVVAQLAHRAAAVAALALLALHAVLLVADPYVDVSVPGALVPFTAGYRGVALGLGTLAAYGFAAAALTGALRGRFAAGPTAARAWRPVHALAYLAWALGLVHGLLAGSDTTQWWAAPLYAGSVAVVGTTVWHRLAAEERHLGTPLARARQHTRAGADR